ncbi:MAG: radical SAM protein [Candidatus Hodarchaeota archaeon]
METYNTMTLTRKTISQVCKESLVNQSLRKYYRFRYSSRFYGGIVTGDVVGCNLRCVYCWSQKTAWLPRKGSWYSAKQVAKALLNLAHKNNCQKIRLSGGEPTLCKDHLLAVLQQIPDQFVFILETNGILLSENDYLHDLEAIPNPPYIRVSLKAGRTLFPTITGASLDIFELQLKTVKSLLQSNLRFNVAIMAEFFTSEEISELETIVAPRRLEIEQLIVYPFVREKLNARGFHIP